MRRGQAGPDSWRKQFTRRAVLLVVFTLCFFAVLAYRLVAIQVVRRSDFSQQAQVQYQRRLDIQGQRGTIYDSRNFPLGVSVPATSFYAIPSEVKKKGEVARVFAGVTGSSANRLRMRLDSNSYFVWLARGLSHEARESVLNSRLDGVFPLTEARRFYPREEVLSSVLGFTDPDGRGLDGLEFEFDRYLRGAPGWRVIEQSALGESYRFLESPSRPPTAGHDIILSLDLFCQGVAHAELVRAVTRHQARAGAVILLEPSSGRILAMASVPVGKASGGPEQKLNNLTTRHTFEPGSAFKAITASAALDAGLIRPSDMIYCEKGQHAFYGHVFHDVKPYGWLDFAEVIEVSSNIGVAKVARKLEARTLYRYSRDFGIGTVTGVQLPGEEKGVLRELGDWQPLSLASVAIGHEISVTPLQLALAFAAIANGGELMVPFLEERIVSADGEVVHQGRPRRVRRVIKKETAEQVSLMLEEAVRSGTGKEAAIPGYRVAGKTGTAQKSKPGIAGYSEGAYTAVFCGYLPADNPELLCLVMLDEPKGLYYGGRVAAPVFRRIMTRLVQYMDIRGDKLVPELWREPGNLIVMVPRLVGNRHHMAESLLRGKQLVSEIRGSGPIVISQDPSANQEVILGSRVTIELGEELSPDELAVPKFLGLSLRQALNLAQERGLRLDPEGTGRVRDQSPRPGSRTRPGSVVTVQLRS
jgi:cell division protein FtsI/penicillin-binding protein 2